MLSMNSSIWFTVQNFGLIKFNTFNYCIASFQYKEYKEMFCISFKWHLQQCILGFWWICVSLQKRYLNTASFSKQLNNWACLDALKRLGSYFKTRLGSHPYAYLELCEWKYGQWGNSKYTVQLFGRENESWGWGEGGWGWDQQEIESPQQL